MRSLILAIQFLTRLPTPQLRNFVPTELTRCAHWFPVVGLLVGAFVAGAVWLGSCVDPALGALLGLFTWVWVTGALHLDGLADMSDALGAAHRDKDKFLSVLADPHLGTFGVVSVVLQLLTKFVLLMLVAKSGHYVAIVLIPAWARWGTLIWARLPSLKEGLGERFGWQISTSSILVWALLLMALSVVAPVLCALPLLVLAWRQFLWHRLGGDDGRLVGRWRGGGGIHRAVVDDVGHRVNTQGRIAAVLCKLKEQKMKLISPKNFWIGAALALLMLATRSNLISHFGTNLFLPDASMAVFLLAGFFFASRLFFGALMVLAVVIDYVAIAKFGVNDYCVTPAYWALIPTYAALWLGGRFYAHLHQFTWPSLAKFAAISFVSVSAAFLISNASFYLLAGYFSQMSAMDYASAVSKYYFSYVAGAFVYLLVAAVIYAAAHTRAEAKRSQHGG
jgi:adenosylcobinamide-GDP ribazoletransferase